MLEPEPENYQLIIQHLLYQTRQVKGQARDAGVITLESKDYNLEEVVIEGERPFVTVEQGKLSYMPTRLSVSCRVCRTGTANSRWWEQRT